MRKALIVSTLLGATAIPAGANTSTPFTSGALIIPVSASFQDDCGAVSAYGLVYDVLRANPWLAANGYSPITIYYSYLDTKASPNRCTPTSLNTGGAPNGPPTNAAAWNDGCDITNVSATLIDNHLHTAATSNIVTYQTASSTTNVNQCVGGSLAGNLCTVLLNPSITYNPTGCIKADDCKAAGKNALKCRAGTAHPGSACIPGLAGDVFCDGAGVSCQSVPVTTPAKQNVYPTYTSKTVSGAATVNYLGGPFIISSQDADTFRKLIDGSLVSIVDKKCSDGTACLTSANCGAATSGVCAVINSHAQDIDGNLIDFHPFVDPVGTLTNATETAPPTSSCTIGNDHHVNIHLTTAGFTANVGKAFQNVPPRLALLATTNDGTITTSKVSNGILEGYLSAAGLEYNGAHGCPPGETVNVADTTLCPNGATSGQIYDAFDFADLYNNQLAAKKGGKALYTMLWTPHWETSSDASTNVNTYESTAFTNITTFLNGQTGLAAECASLASLEGDYVSTTSSDGAASERSGLQLQTCVNDGAGACGATTTPFGIDRSQNPGYLSTSQLVNCSDPGMSNGSLCAFYSYPGDSFAQTADYIWDAVSGHSRAYIADSYTSSIYKPGVVPLISAVTSLDTSKLAVPLPWAGCAGTKWSTCLSAAALNARPMVTQDLSTRNIKDNTAGKANILYLAGHNQTTSVAGTKVMLETLLQLGISTLPPTTNTLEVSRNSPIVAAIGGNSAIVQGTFEETTPIPAGFPSTYSANGQSGTFKFPATKGHLRARTIGTITTTASTFGSSGVIFDAAGAIPNSNYAGCSSNFTSACRTVFTTTSPTNMTLHFLKSSEAALLGPLMSINAAGVVDLDAANQDLLMQRVLAGDDSVAAGSFKPALGGVDRSTVAVIGPSALVTGGAARPTMAYFGATDGMIHAVCASTNAQCDALGRELWAYLPRKSLSTVRYNSARIDGSPRVFDAFVDDGTGVRSWRTVLVFQTGTGSIAAGAAPDARLPAVYAMDVSDPSNPKVLWEYTMANAAAPGNLELGQGLTVAAGRVLTGTAPKFLVWAQTNNLGTGGSGNVVTALNVEKGVKEWQNGYVFTTSPPNGRAGGASVPPISGIPGGAVAVDKTLSGYVSDLVYGTLYGDLWEVNPVTGKSNYSPGVLPAAGNPLLRWSTDKHPFGASPAIYSTGGVQYAVFATGGYADQSATTWTDGTLNYALAVNLNSANAILDESAGAADILFKFALGAGEKGFAEVTIIGNQLFITTDSAANTNDTTYGTTGATTGHVYTYTQGTGVNAPVAVVGGVTSAVSDGTNVYTGAADKTQQLAAGTNGSTGNKVETITGGAVKRKLWLRTQ